MSAKNEKSPKPARAPQRKESDQISHGVPGDEGDGGESFFGGLSREHHPEVPDSGRPAPDDPRSDGGHDQASGGC